MEQNIKPIETLYNGYRFRSRLEARWAVFFDAAGIEYEYEQEGFIAQDGTKYLPDFYLPKSDTYVEVKGEREGAWDEIKKAEKMVVWGGNVRRILILSNIPKAGDFDGGMWHFPCFYWDGKHDCVWVGWFYFCDDGDVNVHGHMSSADYLPPWSICDDGYHAFKRELSFQCVSDTWLRNSRLPPAKFHEPFDEEAKQMNYEFNKMTFEAFKAAQQARFECGEHGIRMAE